MEGNKLHDYVTGAYDRWVAYATRYIRRSRLPIDPIEVVNDVLCSLLERDADRLTQMMSRDAGRFTELDIFVMRVIKTSIYSPQSPFRYRFRRHGMCVLSDNILATDDTPEWANIDGHELAQQTLLKLNTSEIERRVFVWKFLEGNRISKWPGPERKINLYRAYNRIVKKIIDYKVKK